MELHGVQNFWEYYNWIIVVNFLGFLQILENVAN